MTVLGQAEEVVEADRECSGVWVLATVLYAPGSGRGVEGSRFRTLGLRVEGTGCRAQGAGFRLQGSGFRVQGSGFRVQGSGFGGWRTLRRRGVWRRGWRARTRWRVQGSGVTIQGPKPWSMYDS